MSQTNETTLLILDFLISRGIFAWRQNVLPIPILRDGQVTGFRSGGTSGVPDICSILSPTGKFLGIEVKTGKDKIRESQLSFHKNVRAMGGEVLVVKTFEDFLTQLIKSFPHLAK